MANASDIAKQLQAAPAPAKGTTLKALLANVNYRQRFEEVLGENAPAFVSSILSAAAANEALGACEPISIISAAMIAATINLPITPSLGFAHIVPYKGFAQFQVGWKGLVQLALRTNAYYTIHASRVYEGELLEYDHITGAFKYNTKARTGEKIEGYVSYFRLLSGFEKYYYMPCDEVMSHGKTYSMSFRKERGLWVEDPDAMSLKTVTKLNLSKWGILSTAMQKAIRYDQSVVTSIDAEAEPTYPDNPQNALPQATAALPASAVENMGDGPGELK